MPCVLVCALFIGPREEEKCTSKKLVSFSTHIIKESFRLDLLILRISFLWYVYIMLLHYLLCFICIKCLRVHHKVSVFTMLQLLTLTISYPQCTQITQNAPTLGAPSYSATVTHNAPVTHSSPFTLTVLTVSQLI